LNDDIAGDLGSPQPLQTIPNSTFCIVFHIFVVGEHRLQIWCACWSYQVPAYRWQTVPERGMVSSRVFNF